MEGPHHCITIIPAYNEEETIREVVLAAKRYTDVCVVDDGSSDSTPDILKSIEGIHVIHHEKNTHIPGCIRDGMRYAVEHSYRYAITMDAGMSHDPQEIPLFMEHEHTDLLIGYRREKPGTPLIRRSLSILGNIVYNTCLDFPLSIFGRHYRDLTSGFRRYSRDAMKLLLSKPLESRSFDVMIESAHHIYRRRLTISEIPITYRFSNSSLSARAVGDCLRMCVRMLFGQL